MAMDSKITHEVAKKLFDKIADEWALTESEKRSLLNTELTDDLNIPMPDLYKISALIGIYESLQVLLGGEQARRSWIRKPNSEWDGASALDIMSTGNFEDIEKVNRYLKSWREQSNF